MINLEIPPRLADFAAQAHQVAEHLLRPISRLYDRAEHSYPRELDDLADLIDAVAASSLSDERDGVGRDATPEGSRNGANLASVLSITEMCWGDVGLLLSLPRRGLGNSAIAVVADAEQRRRLTGVWASMAITEPEAGSDSAAIRTTAVRDGDELGMGMERYAFAGRTFYGHAGGVDTSGAWLAYLPEEKLAVAYATNAKVYPMRAVSGQEWASSMS